MQIIIDGYPIVCNKSIDIILDSERSNMEAAKLRHGLTVAAPRGVWRDRIEGIRVKIDIRNSPAAKQPEYKPISET